MFQKTIASAVMLEGVGVHSGKKCRIWLFGAPEDSGLTFVRLDATAPSKKTLARRKEHAGCIRADYRYVSNTQMCTKLTNEAGLSVTTVEHLLAALYGLGVSNAVIALLGEEIPTLDGSAKIFATEIRRAKVKEQRFRRKILRVLKPIKVGTTEKWASLLPSDRLLINMKCDFSHRGLTTPFSFSYDFSTDNFVTTIAPARTFGFFEDVELLRKSRLALGGSLRNAVVFDASGAVINKSGLRFTDEPVRHKVLDVIGDLSLCGHYICGQYDGFCSGHQLNNLLLHELFEHKENYEIV
ncbi:MAG: UDP-3-O-acyl-N-acetylglucosamine deacetylase [Holosporaceae bacterium]|nr:UDP-3-O-acyl-N-acetylglucosamine deacetylase [Holosporaceae bacterium]